MKFVASNSKSLSCFYCLSPDLLLDGVHSVYSYIVHDMQIYHINTLLLLSSLFSILSDGGKDIC